MKNLKLYSLKYYCSIFLIIFFFNCAGNLSNVNQEELNYEKVFEFNFSKDELYKYSLDWAHSTFKGIEKLEYNRSAISSNLDSKIVNKNNQMVNRIISTGYFQIAEQTKIKIKYNCKIDCKDKLARITFSDCTYWSEDENVEKSWKNFDRKIKKKLILQFDNYVIDFSNKAINQSSKINW